MLDSSYKENHIFTFVWIMYSSQSAAKIFLNICFSFLPCSSYVNQLYSFISFFKFLYLFIHLFVCLDRISYIALAGLELNLERF